MASPAAKSAIRQLDSAGQYLGYYHLVHEADTHKPWWTDVAGIYAVNDAARIEGVYGVRLADLNAQLGNRFDGLQDPAYHPRSSEHLQIAHLRPDIFDYPIHNYSISR
jgi:hypothetical protein